MNPTLSDHQAVLRNGIHQAIFPINAARPKPGPIATLRFRLADATEGIALNRADQLIDTLETFRIGGLPVQIIIPGMRMKNDLYSIRSHALPAPPRKPSMASVNRAALRGLDIRYSVSSIDA